MTSWLCVKRNSYWLCFGDYEMCHFINFILQKLMRKKILHFIVIYLYMQLCQGDQLEHGESDIFQLTIHHRIFIHASVHSMHQCIPYISAFHASLHAMHQCIHASLKSHTLLAFLVLVSIEH